MPPFCLGAATPSAAWPPCPVALKGQQGRLGRDRQDQPGWGWVLAIALPRRGEAAQHLGTEDAQLTVGLKSARRRSGPGRALRACWRCSSVVGRIAAARWATRDHHH